MYTVQSSRNISYSSETYNRMKKLANDYNLSIGGCNADWSSSVITRVLDENKTAYIQDTEFEGVWIGIRNDKDAEELGESDFNNIAFSKLENATERKRIFELFTNIKAEDY